MGDFHPKVTESRAFAYWAERASAPTEDWRSLQILRAGLWLSPVWTRCSCHFCVSANVEYWQLHVVQFIFWLLKGRICSLSKVYLYPCRWRTLDRQALDLAYCALICLWKACVSDCFLPPTFLAKRLLSIQDLGHSSVKTPFSTGFPWSGFSRLLYQQHCSFGICLLIPFYPLDQQLKIHFKNLVANNLHTIKLT